LFTIIPAIDLKGGRCVRLRQGRAEDSTVYSDHPSEMASRWAAEGARYLHVVDLDGAFQGKPAHTKEIAAIVRAAGVAVEAGGGLRTAADIRAVLACGVDRAIVGTKALAGPDALRQLVEEFAERLAVGIDARDGRVQVRGWVEATGMGAVELACQADAAGVRTLIYTDTSRDGMLAGTNVEAIREVCRSVGCRVIASGGVTSAGDIQALKGLNAPNLAGAIVGKALYEGTVTLASLMAA
jgi:phosphoribosylformimino-5-aminoimidazole carboxamide ribotide isomerase